ncbi:WRKY transcription factor 53 [Carex littledalei]|uniref:WRKY transcription factor 53 n=1 Tax=Carex littledalei TaxID=544730 RepID=A0A833QIS2_9POAL|nr:WRKY transcription factor 53 [Carex littledalei]
MGVCTCFETLVTLLAWCGWRPATYDFPPTIFGGDLLESPHGALTVRELTMPSFRLIGLLQNSRNGEEVVLKQDLAERLFREALQTLIKPCALYDEVWCRVEDNSWINNTSMPYDDGYQWRKYGDKKTSGTDFSRSNFRCTYKEEYECKAKKVVQQTSDGDTPLFQVTYTNKHTCNFCKTISPPTSQSSSFGSIEKDSGINQMPDSMPQLLINQGSCLVDANNLREIYTSASMVERNCEWDLDSLLMDLVGFVSDDYLLS